MLGTDSEGQLLGSLPPWGRGRGLAGPGGPEGRAGRRVPPAPLPHRTGRVGPAWDLAPLPAPAPWGPASLASSSLWDRKVGVHRSLKSRGLTPRDSERGGSGKFTVGIPHKLTTSFFLK